MEAVSAEYQLTLLFVESEMMYFFHFPSPPPHLAIPWCGARSPLYRRSRRLFEGRGVTRLCALSAVSADDIFRKKTSRGLGVSVVTSTRWARNAFQLPRSPWRAALTLFSTKPHLTTRLKKGPSVEDEGPSVSYFFLTYDFISVNCR